MSRVQKIIDITKDADEFHFENGAIMTRGEFDYLVERAKKADEYEELALEHGYQTIIDAMDEKGDI